MPLGGGKRKVGISVSILSLLILLSVGLFIAADEDPYSALRRNDYSTAAKQLRRIAEQGSTRAELALGLLYFEGKGVSQDYVEALKWLRAAASGGSTGAQFLLGGMYSLGQGVPKDFSEAAEWYQKAAERGHARAQLTIATSYMIGQGRPSDDVVAARWFYRAASQGVVEAQVLLASMYVEGKGLPKDYVAAYSWAAIATARAEEIKLRDQAVLIQKAAGQSMSMEEVVEAQRLALAWKPRPQETLQVPGDAVLEQGPIQASLSFEGNDAVVRWRLRRLLDANIELAASIDGRPATNLTSELYSSSAPMSAVVLLLDVSDPDRKSSIDDDKRMIARIAAQGDKQHEIDVGLYANEFQLLRLADTRAETVDENLAGIVARQEPARLSVALSAAIELPSLRLPQRRGIFVFHDGHTDDVLDVDGLIAKAKAYDTSLNFVVSHSSRPIDTKIIALAEATGGIVVKDQDSRKAFIEAPFWPLDSGGVVRFEIDRQARLFWQPDSEVRFVFQVGKDDVVLKHNARIRVAGVEDTIRLLASRRSIVIATVAALLGLVIVAIGIRVLRRRKTGAPANPTIDRGPPRQVLAVLKNELDGSAYPITTRVAQLGRGSDAQIRLSDETVSRIHAILRQMHSGAFEIENSSANGTFVNEIMVDIATLADGDLITVGHTNLRYTLRAPPSGHSEVALSVPQQA